MPEFVLGYRQLLIFAHAGCELSRNIKLKGSHPLDISSIRLAEDFMRRIAVTESELAYPTDREFIDLIAIGQKLDWHIDSKLSIGISSQVGTWVAYRFVIAANTNFIKTAVFSCKSGC